MNKKNLFVLPILLLALTACPETSKPTTASSEVSSSSSPSSSSSEPTGKRQVVMSGTPKMSIEFENYLKEFRATVTGKLRNKTQRTVDYIQITVTFTSEKSGEGDVLGSAIDNIYGTVAPGASWAFEATAYLKEEPKGFTAKWTWFYEDD